MKVITEMWLQWLEHIKRIKGGNITKKFHVNRLAERKNCESHQEVTRRCEEKSMDYNS